MTDAGVATGPPAGVPTATRARQTVTTYGLRLALGAVMGVVIARALSPDGRGGYYIVVMLASTATIIGHLSIGQANVSLWATQRRAIPANTLVLAPLLGLVAAALTWVTVTVLGPGIVPLPDRGLLLLALATVPVGVTVLHLTTLTLLVGRVEVVNRGSRLSAAIHCGALVTLGVCGYLSTTAVVWIWAVCGAIPLLLFVTVLRPHLSRGDLRLAGRMVGSGMQYHIGAVAVFLLLRVDVLILNAMSSAAAVGLYSLAVTMGEMAYVGADALSQSVLRGQAESSLVRAGDLTVRSTRASGVVVAVMVFGLCGVGPLLVPVVYGEAFRPSGQVLYALAPGLLALGATRSIGQYLLRLGRPWLLSTISLSALVVNVGLNVLLIPYWGIVGCAVATSIGYVGLAACQVVWFSRSTGVRPTALLPTVDDVGLIWTEVRGLASRLRRPRGPNRPTGAAPVAARTPLVSVITPTYDRAGTLRVAFDSLRRQDSVLEWIVVDDGSRDGTEELVRALAAEAPFEVRYLWQEHAGKHAAVNRGVAAARAGMVALLDSDDEVLPGALDVLVGHWLAIADPDGYVGVTGLDVDVDGRVVGRRFRSRVVDATWQEMVYRNRARGDKWGIQRADVLRAHPFRPVDGYVSEGEVWRQIGYRYRTRYVNLPVLSSRTDGADRLSVRPFAEVARGAVNQHTLVLTEDIAWLPRHPAAFARSAVHLVRGLLHLGVPVYRQPQRIPGWRARTVWAACVPLGCVLYRRDLRGGVGGPRTPVEGRRPAVADRSERGTS